MVDDWEPPVELLKPVQSISSNLAIMILSSPTVGHEIKVLLGRFISEQSMFTIWFTENVKGGGRDFSDVLALSGFGDEQTRIVYSAWKGYEKSVEAKMGRENVVAAARKLEEALQMAVEALIKIRGIT